MATIHLFISPDEESNFVLSMPEINRQIEFDSSGNASACNYPDIEKQEPQIFESEIYGRIDNAISLAPVSNEAERIFKAELIICKAIIADKAFTSEI